MTLKNTEKEQADPTSSQSKEDKKRTRVEDKETVKRTKVQSDPAKVETTGLPVLSYVAWLGWSAYSSASARIAAASPELEQG